MAAPTLPEQVLLLALHPTRGRLQGVFAYGDLALAGAALEELRLRDAVRLEGKFAVPQAGATGDEVLDALLDNLRRRPEKPWKWHIQHTRLRRLAVQRLEASGAVRHVAAHRLGIRFSRHIPDGSMRNHALDVVRRAGSGMQREGALGALVAATLLGSSGGTPTELKGVKRDLQRLVKGNVVAKAIRDVETAWMVASFVPIFVVIFAV